MTGVLIAVDFSNLTEMNENTYIKLFNSNCIASYYKHESLISTLHVIGLFHTGITVVVVGNDPFMHVTRPTELPSPVKTYQNSVPNFVSIHQGKSPSDNKTKPSLRCSLSGKWDSGTYLHF